MLGEGTKQIELPVGGCMTSFSHFYCHHQSDQDCKRGCKWRFGDVAEGVPTLSG